MSAVQRRAREPLRYNQREMDDAVRWNITVSRETDSALRSFLSSQGMKRGDLSKFIEQAVRSHLFHRMVQDIKSRNAETDPEELQAIIDDAVREVEETLVTGRNLSRAIRQAIQELDLAANPTSWKMTPESAYSTDPHDLRPGSGIPYRVEIHMPDDRVFEVAATIGESLQALKNRVKATLL